MASLEALQANSIVRIVDDDDDLRKGLAFLLDCAGWKSKGYGSAADFLKLDTPSVPGCIILDVQMPGMSGIELQHELLKRRYPLPVIFLSGHGDIDMAVQAMMDGAAHFLQKPVDSGKLLEAIAKAANASFESSETKVSGVDSVRERIPLLTSRELEVAKLVSEGLSSRQVAERLGISERTVEAHRSSANQKLRVSTMSEEAAKALKEWGS